MQLMLPPYNQVQLIGRAGHVPDLVRLADDSYRANLRLYQNVRSALESSATQVHQLVAWNAVARQLEHRVHRGDRLLVQGKLVNRRFTSGGVTHLRTEIHVSHFMLLTAGERAGEVRTELPNFQMGSTDE